MVAALERRGAFDVDAHAGDRVCEAERFGVQHEAPATQTDEWADGSRGYLKRDSVIASMKRRGFEFVGASDVNANPKDQPGDADIVWRLPPTLVTSRQDEELRAKMTSIGESNRMTLKFKKPGG